MRVIARNLKQSDIKPIDDIFNKQPEIGVPSLSNMIVNTVLEAGERILGYGAVKLFAEAVLILDKSLPKRERALALIEAMKVALLYSQDAGIEMIYAISNTESFTKVLENRYKFVRVPGTLLCRNLTLNDDEEEVK